MLNRATKAPAIVRVLACCLLACSGWTGLAWGQDLSLQVNFATPERLRGETLEVGFVVSNPTNTAASSYRVDIFGSLDEALNSDDVLLGSFQSNDGIPQQAFRENSLSLDTCLLTVGSWRIIGSVEDVVPRDSNPLNNQAVSASILSLPGDDEDPSTCPLAVDPERLINPGLNDAWFNPDTPGQGLLLNVYPDTGIVFLAWFTFDLERPAEIVTARLGDAGHRWLTAAGGWQQNLVTLDVTNARGGVFDSAEPAVERDLDYGTIQIEFFNCNQAEVTYDLPVAGVTGAFPIRRVANDNIALCEQLAESPPPQ